MKKRTLVCFLIFTLCVFYTSIPNTVLGQEASLAQQVSEKYSELLQREDIQAVLPQVLEGLKSDQIQGILGANPAIIATVVAAPDLLLNFAPDTDPKFIELLKTDADLKAMLSDPLVQSVLADVGAIDELAGLLGVGAPEPEVTTPEPEVITPEPEVTTPEPEVTTPEPEVTTPEPEVTIPEPEVTTPEPEVTTPEPEVITPEPEITIPEVMPEAMADPFDPVMPTNEYLLGKSRLGGLSLNAASGRGFIEEIIRASGLPLEADALVDAIVDMVPQGFLPKKQIRQILMAKRLSIFENEARHLDYENFGNAITPDFTDFAYLERSTKHLTRDNLQVYMRVPAKVGGVTFNLTGGRTVEGTEVTTDEFQADTISYTFSLDETLAATNLPAWPSLGSQLFSSVTLRYSNTGPKEENYIAVDMQPTSGDDGVVWEAEIGIPSKGSTYYYFEVMLAEPVSFMTLDREAIAAMDPLTVTLAEFLSATKEYRIDGWAMPDPRNLQMVDRGIIDALFTPDFNRAVTDILTSPQAATIIQKALMGQPINVSEFLNVATPKQQRRAQRILERNANRIVTKFETAFDPMLASVFTVPRINPQSESIWVAQIDNIADGNYYLGAVVHDADGNPLDQVQETFTVDTSAPEADIHIMPDGVNATGYENAEGVYVATATGAGAATLKIMGMSKMADVGPGMGYLFYQQIGLDAHGNPQSTWMPLSVESTMLTSRIWSAVLERQGAQLASFLKQAAPQLVGGLDTAAIQGLLGTMTPQSILALLTPDLIQQSANPFLKSLEPFIGRFQLTESQAQLIIDALGATVDIVDHLVPVTFDPSGYVTMPIQGDHMPLMMGDYGVRAMGIDTLFNLGSYTEPTRLRIVAPEADAASIMAVSIGDRNGDGDANEPYESGTIFANTTDGVMLTVTVDNRTVHPASISVEYMDADGAWQPIGEARELTENEEVAMYEVSWDVTDFDALVAAGNTVMVRAVATNALQLASESEPFAIELDAGVHPVDFDVLALVLDAESITKKNPDSGGPQGTVTISGYTPERTYPETTSFQLKVAGEVIGAASEYEVITAEELSELEGNADFLDDLVHTAADAVATGMAEASIYREYPPGNFAKWTVEVDTTALEDTITADSSAARDATKDENQYVVTASAITDAGEMPAPEAVKSHLSVDNVDDVAPLGPTNIVAVTNVADGVAPQPVEANEDGSYRVGGIVDETVPSPMDMLTTEPTADPKTYASVRLIQTDAEGNETVIEGGVGALDITVDVGMLENGTYMFHALAVDEFGNVQTDESPKTAVHVVNFQLADITDLAVTAVDGVDVAESPAEPIALRDSLTVGFMVANGSLAADQLSTSINGAAIASESAEDPETTFSLTVMEISALPDGAYTPEGMVTQWNGYVSFPLAMINLDNTGPMIKIETPIEDHTVDSLPTVHATYEDGAGSGPDSSGQEVLAWATTELPDGPTVILTRILPEQGDQDIMVDQGAIESSESTLVYTRSDQLPGGAYRATVQVADVLGNIGEASVEFAISGTLPAVVIQSPASGQSVMDTKPLISGEISGAGDLEITTFTVDGVDATPEVDGNRFSHTPAASLSSGAHTVVVEVTDGDGQTAQTSTSFTVVTDTTPPVISEVAPSGVVKGDSWVTISAVVTDEQSKVVSAKFAVNDKPFRSVALAQIAQGRVEIADSFTAGTHTVKVVAISEGGTTQHSWTFTLEVDNVAPSITSITPTGTIRGGLPTISASANDASGVDDMDIVLWDSDGKEVKGDTEDDGEDDVEGITRLDFIPEAPLDEGTYTIEVRATDTIGNSATAKGTFSIDFDTAAPVITMSSPQNEARLTERRPQISITYADAESGVDVDSIRFVLDDRLINLKSNQKSASQVLYTPDIDLAFGQHTVKLEVSDMAQKEGNVSEKSSGAREANMAVHEFTFFVESEEGPVLASRPINAPNPFQENTRISFTLTRQSTVSIVIYDMTLRPVRVLVDNEVWDAGEYIGRNAIGWDGTSSSGEDLARGVYFCQIMVADGFEPEYALLKLALTR